VMPVDSATRSRLIKASHRGFKLYQPWLVRIGWKHGWSRATGRLFDISHRIPF
jgi:hypothetical protein